jgi:hypothetical protein
MKPSSRFNQQDSLGERDIEKKLLEEKKLLDLPFPVYDNENAVHNKPQWSR